MDLVTHVLWALMRRSPDSRVLGWLDREYARGLFVTAVSEAEIRTSLGLLPDGRRRHELTASAGRAFDEAFRVRVLPFDATAAGAYADITCQRRAAGRPIGQFGCQIAAIARSRGMAVATRDVEGFAGCGVAVIDPWAAS